MTRTTFDVYEQPTGIDRYRSTQIARVQCFGIVQRNTRLGPTSIVRSAGHSGPMLNTCDTTRVPGFNSRTSFGLSKRKQLGILVHGRVVGADRIDRAIAQAGAKRLTIA